HHAGGGGAGDVDIVDADPGPADHLQVLGRGQHVLVDLGRRADRQPVILADDLQQVVLGKPGLDVRGDAAVAEDVDRCGRELVGNEYARSHVEVVHSVPLPLAGRGQGWGCQLEA